MCSRSPVRSCLQQEYIESQVIVMEAFKPEHNVAGDHVHRAVLDDTLLGLVLGSVKSRGDQLPFLPILFY